MIVKTIDATARVCYCHKFYITDLSQHKTYKEGLMGLERFLDGLEEKRQREAPLIVDISLCEELVEDERWPSASATRVVMPGVRVSGVRISDTCKVLVISQRGIIATPPMTANDLEFLMREGEVPLRFRDPQEILLAREEMAEEEPLQKRIGRLEAKRAARQAVRPRNVLVTLPRRRS